MIKLTDKAIEKIYTISRERYPNEAVFGVIAEDNVIELQNKHSDPINQFVVDAREFYDNGCIALIHSHTVQVGHTSHPEMYIDPRSPSEADMHMQVQMDVPFGILALDEETILPIVWFPDLDSNILGQPYISGVHDCYTLVQKYFWQHKGIKLPAMPHGPIWFEANPKLYDDNYKRYGFVDIPLSDLREGDCILIRLYHNTPTHSAVYMGGDVIWHHVANKLSYEDSLARVSRKIIKAIRYKGT